MKVFFDIGCSPALKISADTACVSGESSDNSCLITVVNCTQPLEVLISLPLINAGWSGTESNCSTFDQRQNSCLLDVCQNLHSGRSNSYLIHFHLVFSTKDYILLSYDYILLSYDYILLSYDYILLNDDYILLSYDYILLSYDYILSAMTTLSSALTTYSSSITTYSSAITAYYQAMIRPDMTEKLLTGTLSLNTTNQPSYDYILFLLSIRHSHRAIFNAMPTFAVRCTHDDSLRFSRQIMFCCLADQG